MKISSLKELIGVKVKIFTKTNFAFRGEIKGIYEDWIQIFDDISQSHRLIQIQNISNLEIIDKQWGSNI